MRQRTLFLAATAFMGLQLQTAAADDGYGPVGYPGVYVTTPAVAAPIIAPAAPVAPAAVAVEPPLVDGRLQALGASVRLNQIHRAAPATNNPAAVRSADRAKSVGAASPRYAVRPSLEAVAVLEAAQPWSVPAKTQQTFDSQVVPAAFVAPVSEQRPANSGGADDANPLRSLGGSGGPASRGANPLR